MDEEKTARPDLAGEAPGTVPEKPADSETPPLQPASATSTSPASAGSPRAALSQAREPLYREVGGYRLRLEPRDLAKLRELPGSRDKTDQELGEQFFDSHSTRLTGAISDDVPSPAEVRVIVDPYSRQAFLVLGKTIRGIVSF